MAKAQSPNPLFSKKKEKITKIINNLQDLVDNSNADFLLHTALKYLKQYKIVYVAGKTGDKEAKQPSTQNRK